jgi:hypothetical protein
MLKRKIHDVIYSAKKPKKAKEVEPESDEDVLKALGEVLGPISGSRHSDKKIIRDINHIYYHSEVDRDSIFDLCELIKEAEEENMFTSYKMHLDPIPIYLHINSYGGSLFAAFSTIDTIKNSKIPIISIIPSCSLMLKSEWPLLLPKNKLVQRLSKQVMDISEYVKFQELKSLFCANGLLSLEEAQTIYGYLGNSVEHFNSQNVIVKSVLTKLFAEMLQKT